MIPLKIAIDGGAWFRVEGHPNQLDENVGGRIFFQIKFLSFDKVVLSQIDDPGQLQLQLDANVWILRVQVVNLCRKAFSSFRLNQSIRLVDEEGYEFGCVEDRHLILYSDFAQRSGLFAFFCAALKPKIKAAGAIPFELPEFFETLSVTFDGADMFEA